MEEQSKTTGSDQQVVLESSPEDKENEVPEDRAPTPTMDEGSSSQNTLPCGVRTLKKLQFDPVPGEGTSKNFFT